MACEALGPVKVQISGDPLKGWCGLRQAGVREVA
jgi:hypothetical protein